MAGLIPARQNGHLAFDYDPFAPRLEVAVSVAYGTGCWDSNGIALAVLTEALDGKKSVYVVLRDCGRVVFERSRYGERLRCAQGLPARARAASGYSLAIVSAGLSSV